MNKNSKTILAVFAGLAAGTVIGLLFAPEKGKDTRNNLAKSLKNLEDKIKEKAITEMNHFNEFTGKVVENIKSTIKQAESNNGQENNHS